MTTSDITQQCGMQTACSQVSMSEVKTELLDSDQVTPAAATAAADRDTANDSSDDDVSEAGEKSLDKNKSHATTAADDADVDVTAAAAERIKEEKTGGRGEILDLSRIAAADADDDDDDDTTDGIRYLLLSLSSSSSTLLLLNNCMTHSFRTELERALCGDANPRRLVRQNAARAPAAMQDTFLL